MYIFMQYVLKMTKMCVFVKIDKIDVFVFYGYPVET